FAPRYEALFRASDSWRARRDLKELLENLPSQLQPLVDFDYMSLLLKMGNPSESCWYTLDEENPSFTRSLEAPVEQAYMSWAFDHERAALFPGFQQGSAFSHSSRLLTDRALQSGCAIPITKDVRHLGAIFFARKRLRPLLDEEMRFLSLVVDRVAIAIGEVCL